MVHPALEDDVGCEAVVMPLQGEEARELLCDGRARVSGDEVEHQVVPARRGT